MGIRCTDSHVARMGQRKQSLIPERELSVSLNPLPPCCQDKTYPLSYTFPKSNDINISG